MHQDYGGVVPELASRDHVRRVVPLVKQVLASAAMELPDLDGIAYTRGPGLAGALLVGASVASALAYALNKPAMGVHHLEGHLLSPLLSDPRPQFPFVALLVSGGHSQLFEVAGVGRYRLLGDTQDDAAGEAFDKTAKLLGLPYPGGPALAALAEKGKPGAARLPRPMLGSGNLDFSFSGLKTAVLTLARREAGDASPSALPESRKADIALEFQSAIVDVLASKAICCARSDGIAHARRCRRRGCEPGTACTSCTRNEGDARRSIFSRPRVLYGQRRDDRLGRGTAAALGTCRRIGLFDQAALGTDFAGCAVTCELSAPNDRSPFPCRPSTAGCWPGVARTAAHR